MPSLSTYCHTGHAVSLHGCSSKVQPLLLTLDMGYLLTATTPDLGRGVSLQGCSSKAQPLLLTLDEGYLLIATTPDLERGVAPLVPPVPMQPPLHGRVVAVLIIH